MMMKRNNRGNAWMVTMLLAFGSVLLFVLDKDVRRFNSGVADLSVSSLRTRRKLQSNLAPQDTVTPYAGQAQQQPQYGSSLNNAAGMNNNGGNGMSNQINEPSTFSSSSSTTMDGKAPPQGNMVPQQSLATPGAMMQLGQTDVSGANTVGQPVVPQNGGMMQSLPTGGATVQTNNDGMPANQGAFSVKSAQGDPMTSTPLQSDSNAPNNDSVQTMGTQPNTGGLANVAQLSTNGQEGMPLATRNGEMITSSSSSSTTVGQQVSTLGQQQPQQQQGMTTNQGMSNTSFQGGQPTMTEGTASLSAPQTTEGQGMSSSFAGQSSLSEAKAQSQGYPEKVGPYPAGGPDAAIVEKPKKKTKKKESKVSPDQASLEQFRVDAAQCEIKPPREERVPATWLTSYPGSGSKLTWKLIEAITGIITGDDYDTTGQASKGVVVAVKTHFPSHTEQRVFQKEMFQGIQRSIMLIRNPLHSIPAFFRFVYFEVEKNKRVVDGSNSSSEPPVNRWIFWRNNNFEVEFKSWLNHAQWWLQHYDPQNLHILPFEYLTSLERGTAELQSMGNFLGSTDPTIASSLITTEQYCCVWEKVIKNNNNNGEGQQQLLGGPAKNYIYTTEQLELMIQSLKLLRDSSMQKFPAFAQLMEEYLGEIVAVKKQVGMLAQDPSLEQQQQQPLAIQKQQQQQQQQEGLSEQSQVQQSPMVTSQLAQGQQQPMVQSQLAQGQQQPMVQPQLAQGQQQTLMVQQQHPMQKQLQQNPMQSEQNQPLVQQQQGQPVSGEQSTMLGQQSPMQQQSMMQKQQQQQPMMIQPAQNMQMQT